MRITIRDGGPGDIPAILGMLDSRVEWLVSQGRTGQWGTKPLSRSPKTVESVGRYTAEGSVFMADADGVPAGTLTLTGSAGAYLSHLPQPGEPERYLHWLASDRRFKGHGVGSALLPHAAEETRRARRVQARAPRTRACPGHRAYRCTARPAPSTGAAGQERHDDRP
ncbi:GNAT family N-acetyltransferase [Streptomyces sp. NPDC047880]|uniref:GNAT family N-acetyltransferase n=1 Tax=Streptomyces sp. NPDC047880 TaxID=3155626 RepID=UPI0034564F68